jgi:hypothetical protein
MRLYHYHILRRVNCQASSIAATKTFNPDVTFCASLARPCRATAEQVNYVRWYATCSGASGMQGHTGMGNPAQALAVC